MVSKMCIDSTLFSFSAGIGRTGVLITMETAMCLIESGQSVYPLDIVRTMRDQRAMMIQTPVSSKNRPLRQEETVWLTSTVTFSK